MILSLTLLLPNRFLPAHAALASQLPSNEKAPCHRSTQSGAAWQSSFLETSKRLQSRTGLPVPASSAGKGTQAIQRGFSVVNATGTPRVFSISDLHTDYQENLEWVEELGRRKDCTGDALIVAGDVTDNLEILKQTLFTLKQAFAEVFFVPGNHELWCRGEEGTISSQEKLGAIMELCEGLGVRTKAAVFGDAAIVPILSWYHKGFDHEPELPLTLPSVENTCMDFRACRWDPPLSLHESSISEYFDRLNNSLGITEVDGSEMSGTEIKQVITFSHFLPRLELCPEKRLLLYPHLAKVSGSEWLERRLRGVHKRLNPDGGTPGCHVFGHTHFRWDVTMENIRYIQAHLGYPRERLSRNAPAIEVLPLLLYTSGQGLNPEKNHGHWSAYYSLNPRDPTNSELAPWVAKRYGKRLVVNRN